MQTISVKVLPATNTKGTRIKASHEGNVESVIAPRDYGLDLDKDYLKTAKTLKMKLGWTGKMQGGHTKDGMVFVFIDDKNIIH